MKKVVLVTGCNGLLGRKLVRLLKSRAGLDLIASAKGTNKNIDDKDYIYLSLDITDFNALKHVIYEYKPTDIINAAAMTNVDACELDAESCRNINVTAVRYLCGLCKETDTKLIHVSTDFVFDGKAGPYVETDKPNPLSVYGKCKLEAEQIIINSGIEAAIIRTVLVYGFAPNLSRTNVVLWVRDALMQQKKISVVNDQIRSPTLAEDLADGVTGVLMKNKTGIFHISGSELMTIHELALRVAKFWNLDTSLIEEVQTTSLNQPAPRPPKTGFVILKAQTELGYNPHTLEAGLHIIDTQIKNQYS